MLKISLILSSERLSKYFLLTIEEAAKKRNINSQKVLQEYIKEKTDVTLRPATISDMYRNNKNQINREHLEVVMKGLGIKDFNEVLKLED